MGKSQGGDGQEKGHNVTSHGRLQTTNYGTLCFIFLSGQHPNAVFADIWLCLQNRSPPCALPWDADLDGSYLQGFSPPFIRGGDQKAGGANWGVPSPSSFCTWLCAPCAGRLAHTQLVPRLPPSRFWALLLPLVPLDCWFRPSSESQNCSGAASPQGLKHCSSAFSARTWTWAHGSWYQGLHAEDELDSLKPPTSPCFWLLQGRRITAPACLFIRTVTGLQQLRPRSLPPWE